MIDPVWGLAVPPALGIFAGLCMLPEWLSERRMSKTPEGRRQVAYGRLLRHYEEQGLRGINAHHAVHDHIGSLTGIEEFRRYACTVYASTGAPLSEIRSEWLAFRLKSIQSATAVTRPSGDAARHARTIKDMVMSTPEDEIFVYEPAASRWKNDKARRDAELEAFRLSVKPDPIRDHVIDSLFAAKSV